MNDIGEKTLQGLRLLKVWHKHFNDGAERWRNACGPIAVSTAMRFHLDITNADLSEAIRCVAEVHGLPGGMELAYNMPVMPDEARIRFCQVLNYYDTAVYGGNQCKCTDRTKCNGTCILRENNDPVTEILLETVRCINQIHRDDYLKSDPQ